MKIINPSENACRIEMARSWQLLKELNKFFEKDPGSLEPIHITVTSDSSEKIESK